MLTEFGRFLRKMRIDKNLLLKNMADDLNVSSSFLSSVEHGKKEVPYSWEKKIASLYDLAVDDIAELHSAIVNSQQIIKMDLANEEIFNRNVAMCFSRKINDMDEDTADRILKILNERSN